MGRGTDGAALAPVSEGITGSAAAPDDVFVAAVRRGDDRAFEVLYQRYHRRIHAYVLGMVKDHGRAEDVTQEVFVNALRRIRATERPIAFRPWIYEIAKNGCIDAFRRARRTEEVSYDHHESLTSGDHARLVGSGPSPDAAVAAKQELENLCGAFGGLSETHHKILVLRELEGLTYEQIGARLRMTRPAVESTLFRARRRLTEEYDELVSGARCRRVQTIIATAAAGAVGTRDARRLSRHLAHCQPCRREALAAGLDRGLLVRRPVTERVAAKVAGLLPLPILVRVRRGGGGGGGDGVASAGAGQGMAAHLPVLSDQMSGGWAKLAAAAALLLAGVGAGVEVHRSAGGPGASAAGRSRPAATQTGGAVGAPGGAASAGATGSTAAGSQMSTRRASSGGSADRRAAGRKSSRSSSGRGSSPAGGQPSSGSGGSAGAAGDVTAPIRNATGARKPKLRLPTSTSNPLTQVKDTVKKTTDTVADTVQQTTGTVQNGVQQTTGTAQGAAGQTTGAAQDAAGQTSGAAQGAAQQATGAVGGVVGGG